MIFENLRIKEIVRVIRYQSTADSWISQNRRDHIIGIQLAGAATHTFAHDKFVISENCIYFLNQKDDFMVNVLKKHSQAFSIHFTTYADIPVDSFCIPLQTPAPILSILQKAETAYKTGDELTTLSHLYMLCAEFERIREKLHSWTDRRIITAKKYIDFHFQEKNCLHMAIAESSLGERRFQDLFRESFHTTANRYIIGKKVAYAKDLLSVGGLQIAEIAQLCGFSDVYYFSKVFKQETGISPGRWKMQG